MGRRAREDPERTEVPPEVRAILVHRRDRGVPEPRGIGTAHRADFSAAEWSAVVDGDSRRHTAEALDQMSTALGAPPAS